MNYITIALRTNDEGGTGAETLYSGKDERVAERKWHEEMADAATSGRPMHAAIIVRSDGIVTETGYFEKAGE